MTATGDDPASGGTTASAGQPKILAFYLPQFHPIPENDEWWEPGFTEWTNVVRARPLFPGHYQPHLPGELGYYDLRVPEVRERQAALARQYGISGFVYYHYWFHGRRLLEQPFDEVLRSGRPDFPFALCWANEEWTRNWDALSGSVLVEQTFSEKDDLDHIRWLIGAFADRRYITVDGRPLMLIYRSDLLPDARRTTELWRSEARAAGFPDIYLALVESRHKHVDPRPLGFDATVGFRSDAYERLTAPLDAYRENVVLDYGAAVDAALHRPPDPWTRLPGVMVGWDNTARRKGGAVIFAGGTPANYERWLRGTIESVSGVRDEEKLVFVAAWNEWAEGNHLEPDRHYGRGYLEATLRALTGSVDPDVGGGIDPDGAAGHLLRLLLEVKAPPPLVIEIGTPTPGLAAALADAEVAHQVVDLPPGVDVPSLLELLEKTGDPGALVVTGILEHHGAPTALLSGLADWARGHAGTPLLVSVDHVGHFDAGLRLLAGGWDPPGPGTGEPVVTRHFTRSSLEGLLHQSGWAVTATHDHESMVSSRHPTELAEELPDALTGALQVLAQTANPDWAVDRFVWALAPSARREPPDAGGTPDEAEPSLRGAETGRAVSQYFSSIGLVAGEHRLQVEERLRRARSQSVRKAILQALVSLTVPDRWAEELPLLADTVEELADLYLARVDLVSAFDDDGSFDAARYVQWAAADQPMVGAAVARLSELLAHEVGGAVRDRLGRATADRELAEPAAELLVDLYLHRWDLRFTLDDGAGIDIERLLQWAATVGEGDDPAAARLAPYRTLVRSALAPAPARLRPRLRPIGRGAVEGLAGGPSGDGRRLSAPGPPVGAAGIGGAPPAGRRSDVRPGHGPAGRPGPERPPGSSGAAPGARCPPRRHPSDAPAPSGTVRGRSGPPRWPRR